MRVYRGRWLAFYARRKWHLGVVTRRTSEQPAVGYVPAGPERDALEALGLLSPVPPPFVPRVIHRSFFLGPFELRFLRR